MFRLCLLLFSLQYQRIYFQLSSTDIKCFSHEISDALSEKLDIKTSNQKTKTKPSTNQLKVDSCSSHVISYPVSVHIICSMEVLLVSSRKIIAFLQPRSLLFIIWQNKLRQQRASKIITYIICWKHGSIFTLECQGQILK